MILYSYYSMHHPRSSSAVVNNRLPELTQREKAIEQREEALRKSSASASAKEMQLALQSAEINEKLADAQRVENLAVEVEIRQAEMKARLEKLQRRETGAPLNVVCLVCFRALWILNLTNFRSVTKQLDSMTISISMS